MLEAQHNALPKRNKPSIALASFLVLVVSCLASPRIYKRPAHKMVREREVLGHRPRHNKKSLHQSRIFPFLELPLEIRIVIYGYMLANGDQGTNRRRLPSLFHTNLQITREIYRYCGITVTWELRFPNFSCATLSQLPRYRRIPYVLCRIRRAFALVVIYCQLGKKLESARIYAAYKERKGLRIFIRTRCRDCEGLAEWQRSQGCYWCRITVVTDGWQEMWKRYGSSIEHY